MDKKVYPETKPYSDMLGLFGKLSGTNTNWKMGVRNEDTSLAVKGVLDTLTVSVQAGLKSGQDGDIGFATKTKAAVFSGRATFEYKVLGWEIEFGVSGDALSIGYEAAIGKFDGAFEGKANASFGLGAGFVFRAKPPQQ